MTTDYEARQAARRERLARAAERARRQAAKHYEASDRAVAAIPFGQPILVGHHSERRHRRDLRRAQDQMSKSVAAARRAERLEEAAEAVGRGGISSDDPNAIEALREKVVDLEAMHAECKRLNAAYRRAGGDVDEIECSPKVREKMRETMARCPWLGKPFDLTRFTREIRRCKERISELEQRPAGGIDEVLGAGGYRIVEDREANRIFVEFIEKPPAEVRGFLKASGFRWSPSRSAWSRMLNAQGRAATERVVAFLVKGGHDDDDGAASAL